MEMLAIAAMCSVGDPFVSQNNTNALRTSFQRDDGGTSFGTGPTRAEMRKRLQNCIDGFISPLGDHITLWNVYNGFTNSGTSRPWCEEKCLQVGCAASLPYAYRYVPPAQGIRGHAAC